MAGDKETRRSVVTELAPIRPDELYPLRVLKQRLGIGDAAVRAARRDGLNVQRYGNLHYVFGSDVIEFLSHDKA